MHRYKTVVTDYEGMQGHLDTHAAQGWKLFSVTPDTWRMSLGRGGMEDPPFADLPAQAVKEYSASYYLLVFQRDDTLEDLDLHAVAEEALPAMDRYEE